MTQLALFSRRQFLSGRKRLEPLSPREEAEKEIRERPQLFALYEQMALDYARKRQHFGINLLRELARWHGVNVGMGKEYKVKNALSPYYARKLMEKHPGLKEWMELRKVKY